jgi:hypothetical protein
MVIIWFGPLGLELMAIGIKVNKFSILYTVNNRHDIKEHKNQQLQRLQINTAQKIDAKTAVKYQYQK